MTYKLFLAWQSQNKDAEKYVKKQLNKVVKHIAKNNHIDLFIIKSPTQEETGSPDIIEKIWEQIADSDVFVGDLSHICELKNGNQVSNSNVMYETGIADSLLGRSRTILLCSKKTDIEKIAFDLNHRRISPFDITNEDFYKELSEWIIAALQESIRNQYFKKFVCKEIIYNIEVLYNNFIRLVYSQEIFFEEEDFEIFTEEKIKERIQKGIFNIIQVKIDYHETIYNIEEKIKELYVIKENELIMILIKIVESLIQYQLINQKSRFSQFEEIGLSEDFYSLHDNATFYIINLNEIPTDGIFFRENVAFLSMLPTKPLINVYMKNTIQKVLKECTFDIQHNMTVGKLRLYKMKEDTGINTYAKSIFCVLSSIKELLNYLKLETCSINIENGKLKSLINFIDEKI